MKKNISSAVKQLIITLPVLIVFVSCAGFIHGGSLGPESGVSVPWIVINGPDSDSVTINWITANKSPTQILFGENGTSLEMIGTDSRPVRQHHLELSRLEPGAIYTYGPVLPGMSKDDIPLYEFKAPPEKEEPARIIIVGDMQPKNEFTVRGCDIISEAVAAESPDMVIQLGDVSEIGGFAKYWDLSLAAISDYSAEAPLQAIAGNHDQYADGGRNFRKLFPYEYVSRRGLYYSFDYGSAHFVMMDGFDKGGKRVSDDQKVWVENDIDSARVDGAEWIFLIIHDTVLSSGTMGSNEELLAWMVPMTDRKDVDAVFFGHDHHYEHWAVNYGEDGYVFAADDEPGGNTVHYFCGGGGGAPLETDYGLLEEEYAPYERTMYRVGSGDEKILEIQRHAWDRDVFIDYTGKTGYGRPEDSRHYYQLPGTPYRSDSSQFGYEYGEQTLQYIIMEIDGNILEISVHYPNGELISGPDGTHPQEFLLVN